MGLQQLDANGNLAWNCHSGTCPPQTAHISHAQVEHIAPDAVLLPPCPKCGSRMGLKTVFSDVELKAPNMVDRLTGRPTSSYAMAQRHIQLVHQLEAAGKGYNTVQDTKAPTPQAIDEQHALRLFQKLGYTANSLAEVGALIEQQAQASTPSTSSTAG